MLVELGLRPVHQTVAVWDQYKARFLKVYKEVDEETLCGNFLSQASSPFG